MLYTLFVLTFGIYLGQEYPQIPSIKTTVQMCIEKLGKEETSNKSSEQSASDSLNTEKSSSSTGAFERIIVPKRNYTSLPIWVSHWWSSSEENSDESQELQESHEKTE